MKNRMSVGRDQTKSLSFPMTPLLATAAMVLMRMLLSFNYTLTAALMCGCGS